MTEDEARHILNDSLLRADVVRVHWYELVEHQGLKIPLCRSTVHRWMMRSGCTHDRAQQAYYTDDHDRPDVVEYREQYTEALRTISLYLSLWVHVCKDLSSQALDALSEDVDRQEVFEYVNRKGLSVWNST